MRTSIFDSEVKIYNEIQPLPNYPPLCDEFIGEKRYIDNNGVKIYTETLGQGIPIIFIHGGPGSSHHYFHKSFRKPIKGLQLVFYDQRGCYKSGRNKTSAYTLEDAVNDIEAIRDELNYKRVYLLGHSFGGLLAQLYKQKYPQNLLGIILVCSSLGFKDERVRRTGKKYISDNELNRIHELDCDESISLSENIYNSFLNGDWKRQNYYKPTKKEMYYSATYEWDYDSNLNASLSHEMDRYNLQGKFTFSKVPTLIIEGEKDPTWSDSKKKILHLNHPGSELIIIKNSSHEPFFDNYKEFVKILKQFTKKRKSIK